MSTAVESFFDITTGRNHGVVPTADALRVVLDTGATLLLDKVADRGRIGGAIRARAVWPCAAPPPPPGLAASQRGMRTVELVMRDGPPTMAVCGVTDMATGRRFGMVTRIDLEIAAEGGECGGTAALSYMEMADSTDGTLSPDREPSERVTPQNGKVVTERVRVGRITAAGPDDAKPAAEAVDERIDKALSALVGKLILGDSGVEVTEWAVPSVTEPDGRQIRDVRFGQVAVPLFAINPAKGSSADDEVARQLVGVVEMARRERGGRIDAVVVRVANRGELVGVACLPGRPEPPVGATLVARRMVGGAPPCADVPWPQVERDRLALVRRAIAAVKHDCALAGFNVADYVPRLSLLLHDGREAGWEEVSWMDSVLHESAPLARAVVALKAKAEDGEKPVALRVAAERRTR